MTTTINPPNSAAPTAPAWFIRRIMAGVIGGGAGGTVFGSRLLTGYLHGLLGATREATSKTMSNFASRGLIRQGRVRKSVLNAGACGSPMGVGSSGTVTTLAGYSNICSNTFMRWSGQQVSSEAPNALPGLARLNNLVRTIRTPDFDGVTFYEVLAKSALNKVPTASNVPLGWTINPMRGCIHQCTYCFARPTHEFLDLDAGKDFDTQIVVKVNVAEVLAKELSKPNWGRHPVALGTNTDPYQRAEGRYRLMPSIIAALAGSGTPLSILTKGTLLRRDLALLVEASEHVPVDIGLSIAIYDDELQQSVEPGTPTAKARLATVTAVREAGLDCAVFLMPILPFLTDTRDHLERAVAQVKAAGGTSIMYSALHLKSGTKEWYFQWLERAHPELVQKYHSMYARGSYAPQEYRQWLAAKLRPIIHRHGLERTALDLATGIVGSRAQLRTCSNSGERSLIAEELPPGLAARAMPQPMLF